ncbi:hypothetical protein G9A89_010855 [Geosiphon pyriformis]|nr:hypothetical protein G9A89_010855 [Geosiphon pyriformis]
MAHILKDLIRDHQCYQDSDCHCLSQISEFLISKSLQLPLQLPPQQTVQQQSLQLPPQQPNLDPMAYTPIAKLDNFTSEEDNTQIWLNDIEKAIVANE